MEFIGFFYVIENCCIIIIVSMLSMEEEFNYFYVKFLFKYNI